MTGILTVWDTSTATNLTLNGNTSSIVISDTSTSPKTFSGGGKIYHDIAITGSGTGAVIIDGSNTFTDFTINAPKTVTFTSNTTQTIAGTFTSIGTSGNIITINSSTAGVPATLSKASGTVSGDYLSIKDSTANGGAAWYAGTHSTNVSGNSGWIFTNPSYTYSGVVYSNEGITPLGSQTVALGINGVEYGTTSISDPTTGAWSILAVSSSGDILAFYLKGMTADAVTVTVNPGASTSGINLYQNYLITRQDNSGSLTNANLATAATSGGADISNIYAVASGNLTVQTGKSLLIPASHTFAPGGNVTTPTFILKGNYTHDAETLTVSSSLNQSSGTFSAGSGSISTLNFALSGGTFNSTSGVMTIAGSFTKSGTPTFNANGGTVTFGGTYTGGNTSIDASGVTFNLVTISRTIDSTNQLTLTIAAGTIIPFGNSPTLTLNNTYWQGRTYNLTNNGTITIGTGTALSLIHI